MTWKFKSDIVKLWNKIIAYIRTARYNILLIKTLRDFLSIGFIVFIMLSLYSNFEELGLDFKTMISTFIILAYSLTLSFSVMYRRDEKALKMLGILIPLLSSKYFYEIFELTDKVYLIIVLVVLQGYFIVKVIEKKPLFLIFFSYTLFSMILYPFFLLAQLNIHDIVALHALYLLIFVFTTLIINAGIIVYYFGNFLGFSLVYCRVPKSISFNELKETLIMPDKIVECLAYDDFGRRTYFRNVVTKNYSLTSGLLIYDAIYVEPRFIFNNNEVKIPLVGYFHK